MSKPTLLIPGNLEAIKWSPKQKELDTYVPLDYVMEFFNDRIPLHIGENPKIKTTSPADKMLILQSFTGGGKTTLIPTEFFHKFQERTRKNIAVTEPRVLNAVDISRNTIPPYHTKESLVAAGYPNREPLIFGKNIGVQTGPISKRPIKGIIFMTPGVIIQQLNVISNEEFMKKYSIIIVDEVHERSLETDMILYLLKKFINSNYQNKECPFLLIMSATFDTIKFTDYLLSEVPAPDRYKNIIKVKGFTFPIDEYYLKYDSQNYMQNIIDHVIEIHEENMEDFLSIEELMKRKKGKKYKLIEDMGEDKLIKAQKFRDVLIFVRGPSDILKLKKKVNQLNSTHEFFQEYPVLPLGLTSDLVTNQTLEYRNAVEKDIKELSVEVMNFNSKKGRNEEVENITGGALKSRITLKKPTRRIIISTNVSETGITLETLKYVIDPGFAYSNEFNPNFGVGMLLAKNITQGQHLQRRGRAGRKAKGICYTLFTEKIFNKMQVDQYPDIIKNEITLDLLNILIREVDPENEINDSSIFDLFNREKEPDKMSKFEEKINQAEINIYKLDLLDLPSADSLHYSMEKLYTLGAINSNSIPTALGFIINKFRFIKIESIKMILAGFAWNCPVQDLVTMAAFLNFKKDALFPEELQENYKEAQMLGKFTLFANEQKRIISYSELKTELVLMDEFMKYILIFYEFQNKLAEINIKNLEATRKPGDRKKKEDLSSKNILETMQNWGDEYGISIKAMLDVIELRDSIINVMSLIGLNPFHNHNKAFVNITGYSDLEKIEYVNKIKQCIFEGYKLNLAVYNNIDKKYYLRKTHLPINIQSEYILSKMETIKFGDSNPKYIIYDKIDYMLNPLTNIYEPIIGHISIMDGYVTIDPNFDSLV